MNREWYDSKEFFSIFLCEINYLGVVVDKVDDT